MAPAQNLPLQSIAPSLNLSLLVLDSGPQEFEPQFIVFIVKDSGDIS